MRQQFVPRRLRIERIPAIDEREKKTGLMGAAQQEVNQERAPGTQVRSAQFRNRAFRQTAAECLIDPRQSSRKAIARRCKGLWEPLGQELSQIDSLH